MMLLHGKISTSNLTFYNFITDSSAVRNSTSAPVLVPGGGGGGGDTMYTNLANLQQTMLLQQRMFLQALCQQNSIVKNTNQKNNETNNDPAKKHFIAPSLSQYRFVSGQQVSVSLALYNAKHLQSANKNDCLINALLLFFYFFFFGFTVRYFRHIHTHSNRNRAKSEWNGK